MSIRQEYNDLIGQRARHLAAAEAALNGGDRAAYQAALNAARAMDGEIGDKKALIDEQDRYAELHAPSFSGGTQRDLEEMGRMLAAGEPVKFSVRDMLRPGGQRNATLITGTLVEPTGAGSDVRDGFAGQVSTLIDQVSVLDLTGMTAYEEPYVVSDMEAVTGEVKTMSGTTRTDTDPTFAKAAINPYEVSVTSFVDRNLSRYNPANYAAKVQTMAMRALRRKVNSLIALGDSSASPTVYGITNATNTDDTAIYTSLALTAIDENTLDQLVFGYGGDEAVGGNARLYLTKVNLQAIGALRGTNEKRRLYKITPDAGSANTGVIEDGGLLVPYTIVSDLGDSTLAYGDPANYELGLFGSYIIRVDEHVKAVERMHAILGDVSVGGNLVIDKGFVIGTIGA